MPVIVVLCRRQSFT